MENGARFRASILDSLLDDHDMPILFRENDLHLAIPIHISHAGMDLPIVPKSLDLGIGKRQCAGQFSIKIKEIGLQIEVHSGKTFVGHRAARLFS